MAKTKKPAKKKRSSKPKAKRSVKKAVKKPASRKIVKKSAKKKPAAKAKKLPKKKASVVSPRAIPAETVKKAASEEENTRTKLAPPTLPKEPDLEDEEIVDEELDLANEGGMEEDMEEEMDENLPFGEDEEDVDYLEESEDLLDDTDDFRP
ncbi:hypothetical protein [Petrachloros mirabilis]